MWNFDWPKAYPETSAHGTLKLNPEDFQVDEIPLMSPKGEGEHIYLHIKKREVNTHWVSRLLAEKFGVKEHDVSYAGQKDRYAVTTQWFSIYAPKIELVLASSSLTIEGKRGKAELIFNLIADDKIIGHGKKHMLLSGLRPYEQEVIDGIIEVYNNKKSNYLTKS